MIKERIYNVVIKSIQEFNETSNNNIGIEKGIDTALFGESGVLDSLGLVNLIVKIEEDLADEFNTTIIITSEKAMSRKTSPFLTIGTLIDYIEEILSDSK